eukprot:g1081.t1
MSSSSARAAARARGGRTRKPLYPRAWGSGKNPFKGVYKAYSMVASGRDDLECGDKIILPEEAFREVSRLRLEFPLTMMLANARKGGPRGPSEGKAPVQVCGVLEFSAPKGVCHIPQWIMTSLSIREGGRINVKSAPKLPKGEFVRFRPRDQAFMDFSQALGVRNILEITMQHYSALSVGQTVFIQYGSDKFFLDVVELRPAKAISLYGSVDLEVEFAEVGEGDLPSPITKNAVLEENLQPSNGNQKATTTTMASKGAGRARSSPSSTPRSSRPRPRQAKKVESKTSSRTAAGSSSSRARDKRNPSRQQSGPAKRSNASSSSTSSSSSSSNAAAAPTSGAGLSKRQQRLAQFRKSSMTSAVSAAPTASIAGNSLTTATTGAASQSQGNVAGPATAVTEEPSRKKEKDGEDGEEEQRHRWGTGVTLDGKVVSSPVATPKQAPAASAPSAASAGTGNDDGDKEDTGIAFTGSGNTLGGGGGGDASSETKKASAVPWADIARQRHQRHAKKMAEERRKQEEAARKLAEEALAKQQAEAAAALAAMTEEELARKQEEERLARKRAELESQIEEKLIRDAELKEKKEQRRQKKKQELADREAAMNRQMEELEAAAVAEAVQKSVEAQTAHAPSTPAEVEEAMVAAAIVDSVSSRTPAPAAVAAPTPEPAPSIASQNASSFKYADQLASLVDMGFTDVHSNEAALEACGGDVHRAVGMLTGSTESSSRRRQKPANGRMPAVGSAVNAARNQQRRGVGSSGSSMPRKNDRYNKGGRKRTPPMGSRSKRF